MHSFELVTEDHMVELAENIRPEERDEVFASHGQSPMEAITRCVERSTEAYTTLEDGVVMSITGCAPRSWLSGIGSPWLLTTTAMRKSPRHLLRHTRHFLDQWKQEYDVLINWVDARYEGSLRWARWAGFTVHPAEPFGFLQLPFHMIEIRKDK